MIKYLLALVLLTPFVHAQICDNVCSQYRQFARAIAKQEGFYVRGSLSARNRNPGDIKSVYGYKFPGQVGVDRHGHLIFKNDTWGWAALQNQVRKMCASEGRYSADMTIQEIGHRYAKDWKRWSVNVSKYMGCDPRITLSELFDIPPVLHLSMGPLPEGVL